VKPLDLERPGTAISTTKDPQNSPTKLAERYAIIEKGAMIMDGDTKEMALLNAGITPAGQGDGGTVWNILGQTYYLKESCDSAFAFEVVGEPGTFVPPHIHPTQDEFIYLVEGQMELTLDGKLHTLETGGMARMPMGIAHGYKNIGIRTVRALFWVSPSRKLHELFNRIHNLTDPAEVVKISATCEVNFLPPPA
jgi:quercetin dioxygenase-like cupin family protein